MTDTKDDDLVKLLREVSLEKQQEAWARSDGGQDLTIGAMLADEAADRIEELEAKLAKAVEALEAGVICTTKHGGAAEFLRIARATLAELKGQNDE
jgi:hypothetical protein